ncbi:MAG: EutN/CcmL family microcompartment protein [Candidatus Eisenbacteria bacterium]
MRLGRVLGTVVCTMKVESLAGKRLLLVQPEDERGEPYDHPLVAIDTVSAGPGDRVCFVEKREAAKAWNGPELVSDVTLLGIVDEVNRTVEP